ncbi:MAG TPA: ATP-binding protein [Kofleriaceae bacterium]|nr:ATP-binding protein [Kofleriaceae bacterium]
MRWARTVRPRQLRLRLRTKLVVAMAFAALVPVLVVALLATGVILSSLEASLREDADRQLGVAVNLILRAVERLGEETIQLAESSELPARLDKEALDAWLSHRAGHVPSARLQLLDPGGAVVFNRVLGGAEARFADVGVRPGDPAFSTGRAWGRGVALVAVGDEMIVRAVSPIVDVGLALRGVLVLSMPLDADFADGIKGALSADVLLGGATGPLQTTFPGALGGRTETIRIPFADQLAALGGRHVIRDLDVGEGKYKIAVTALLDRKNRSIGLVGVAVDRGPLAATKRLAVRSLGAGGLAALAFALVLALFWSRRLGAPIAELHRGAIAVSRGDLDHRIDIPGGDELTDLATAFNQMTSSLQDNQARLAARMSEIVALHDAGRAMSSVIDLESVARKIVDAVARTFDVQLAALWLVDADAGLRATAARARSADGAAVLSADEALVAAEALRPFAERVRVTRLPLRQARATDPPGAAAVAVLEPGDPDSPARPDSPAPVAEATAARDPAVGPPGEPGAGMTGALGPVVALPLDRKARVVGVLAVARARRTRVFSEADLNLLTTFADQAGAAVENALLYSEVREASEELEKKVRLRTTELTEINDELGKALADLREAQAQLVLSERMAGLGLLVAGVAHEINSPSAAIRGSIDGLTSSLARVSRHGAALAAGSAPVAVTDLLEALAPVLAERALPTGLTARKAAREIAAALEAQGGPPLAAARTLAAELADLGASPDEAVRLIEAIGPDRALAGPVVAALTDHVYLHRTASTVRHAVASIQRIVGALKSYSHLDQQAVRTEADIHEGLETTLALLHHSLRDIVVERRFGSLPRVPVFVDELNQVWTNLIQNAQQALTNRSSADGKISIATDVEGLWVVVRVTDNGPGVPPDVLPRIFEPFFTTKAKGEGTGLGLGIARQIVHKHGGTMRCESEPGGTTFEVRLPVASAR